MPPYSSRKIWIGLERVFSTSGVAKVDDQGAKSVFDVCVIFGLINKLTYVDNDFLNNHNMIRVLGITAGSLATG